MNQLTHEYLLEHYVNNLKSTYQIAEEFGTYPNKVRRALIDFGIPLRDKSQAQEKAIKTGRCKHPTKGKKASEQTKNKISDSIGKNWREMDEAEKIRRSQIAKQKWESMPLSKVEEMQKAAAISVRAAATYGSKLEKFLLNGLRKEGYKADFHKEFWAIDRKQHIDIFISEYNLAIEIDGPSHFKNIWGEDVHKKQVVSDSKKTGFIISAGMKMIRVKNIDGNSSGFYMRNVLKKVLDTIDLIKNGAKENLFELE